MIYHEPTSLDDAFIFSKSFQYMRPENKSYLDMRCNQGLYSKQVLFDTLDTLDVIRYLRMFPCQPVYWSSKETKS